MYAVMVTTENLQKARYFVKRLFYHSKGKKKTVLTVEKIDLSYGISLDLSYLSYYLKMS